MPCLSRFVTIFTAMTEVHCECKKRPTIFNWRILIIFTFGFSKEFEKKSLSFFPPHLNCEATLPCEIKSLNWWNLIIFNTSACNFYRTNALKCTKCRICSQNWILRKSSFYMNTQSETFMPFVLSVIHMLLKAMPAIP